jgi:O-antigen ligase
VEDSVIDIEMRLRADRDTAFGKKYSDLEERVYMWYWATHLFIENPVIGVGTGGYNKAMRSAGAEVGMDHPHNSILHMAVSYGVIGLLVLFWFFFVLIRTGWYNRATPQGFFIFSGGLVIFVGGFLNSHIIDANPAFLLAVLTGLQAGFALKKPVQSEDDLKGKVS